MMIPEATITTRLQARADAQEEKLEQLTSQVNGMKLLLDKIPKSMERMEKMIQSQTKEPTPQPPINLDVEFSGSHPSSGGGSTSQGCPWILRPNRLLPKIHRRLWQDS